MDDKEYSLDFIFGHVMAEIEEIEKELEEYVNETNQEK